MSLLTAIILAAGEGKRLRPLTNEVPKCLAPVQGRPILGRTIDALQRHGIQKIIIVAGYKAHVLEQWVHRQSFTAECHIIRNDEYAQTNSMYSLHLGLEFLSPEESTWVLEGDIAFDPAILPTVQARVMGWVIDSQRDDMDGAYLRFDQQNRIQELQLFSTPPGRQVGWGKSVGITQLSGEGATRTRQFLAEAVQQGQSNLYCDLIYKQHLNELSIEALDIAGGRWMEVDNANDLAKADIIFS